MVILNLPGPLCSKKVFLVAEGRAKQYKELYSDGGVLFCQYCEHSVNFVQRGTSLKQQKRRTISLLAFHSKFHSLRLFISHYKKHYETELCQNDGHEEELWKT